MLNLCELSRSTFRSWSRFEKFSLTTKPAYDEKDVLTVGVITQVRRVLASDDALSAWASAEVEGEAARILNRARSLQPGDRLDLVIEPTHLGITAATTDAELAAAVRHPTAPRALVVLDVAAALVLLRTSFWRHAQTTKQPAVKRAGRPKRAVADVREFKATRR